MVSRIPALIGADHDPTNPVVKNESGFGLFKKRLPIDTMSQALIDDPHCSSHIIKAWLARPGYVPGVVGVIEDAKLPQYSIGFIPLAKLMVCHPGLFSQQNPNYTWLCNWVDGSSTIPVVTVFAGHEQTRLGQQHWTQVMRFWQTETYAPVPSSVPIIKPTGSVEPQGRSVFFSFFVFRFRFGLSC
jgi:hypothetical protein